MGDKESAKWSPFVTWLREQHEREEPDPVGRIARDCRGQEHDYQGTLEEILRRGSNCNFGRHWREAVVACWVEFQMRREVNRA